MSLKNKEQTSNKYCKYRQGFSILTCIISKCLKNTELIIVG